MFQEKNPSKLNPTIPDDKGFKQDIEKACKVIGAKLRQSIIVK